MRVFYIFFFCLLSSLSFAQQGNQNIFPHLDIRSIITFDVSVTGRGLDYYFRNTNQIERGLRGNNIFRATVKSNQNWIMSVHSDSETLLDANTLEPSRMPCSIIGIRKENSEDFLQLSTIPQNIASGGRGNDKKSGNSFSMDLEITPGEDAEAGEFCMNIVFTITPD
ncbi:hypothetical protein [Jiulongibacter sp. NS-SX5]|uniref:hypothetical protein n=1 Tax=Jiulongibacter sp. NS-SX5 TaxID=3463854 RepID=UPI00405A23F4